MLILAIAGGALVAVCAICSIAVALSAGDEEDPTSPAGQNAGQSSEPAQNGDGERAQPPAPEPTTEDVPAGTITQRGMLLVGSDIQPGTYRGTGCGYWQRVSDASGDFDSIIANGNIDSGAVLTVTIADGDFGFDNSCDRLYPLDLAPAAAGSAGILAVGKDIEPGTWSGTAVGNCYWARLSGFSGEFNDILANDNIDPGERFVIDVLPGDAGLELGSDCGQLSRI
jgi:hypothetical protein